MDKAALIISLIGTVFVSILSFLTFKNGYEPMWHLLIAPSLMVFSVASSFKKLQQTKER